MRTSGQQRRCVPGGFLLLEVIIAVTFFAIVVVSLVVALQRTAKAAEVAREEAKLSRILESAMKEALSVPVLEEGTTTVVIEELELEIDTAIEPLELENQDGQLLQGMFRIKVTALMPKDGEWQEQRSAQTYRYAQLYQPQ
jgi:type II secretory pathway pseudopilin PulG